MGPYLSLSWGTEKLRTRLKLEKFASWEGTFTFTGELKLTTDLMDTRSSSSSVSSSAWDWEGLRTHNITGDFALFWNYNITNFSE